MVLVGGAWLFAAISLIVTLTHKITWLTYLYYFSYIKLGVTLIKYVPQVRQHRLGVTLIEYIPHPALSGCHTH